MQLLSILSSFVIAVLTVATVAFCTPMDRRAHDILGLAPPSSAPDNARKLTLDELTSVVEATKSESAQVRMAGAYALAFTDTQAGVDALRALQIDTDPLVAGVAQVALLRNQVVQLKGAEQFGVLSFKLGYSDLPWSRVLLVSWLGDAFGPSAMALFLTALEVETDAVVRAELFFQIASHGDSTALQAANLMLKKDREESAKTFRGSQGDFLNKISSNPRKRASVPGFLERLIESRLEEERAKEK